MRSPVIAVLALAGIALALASALAQLRRGGGESGWLFSLEAGKQLARQTGKPLLVVLRCAP